MNVSLDLIKSIDLSLSDREIVKIYRQFGIGYTEMGEIRLIVVKADWTKSNAEIASQFGVSVSFMRNLRKKYRIPEEICKKIQRNYKIQPQKIHFNWETINWDLNNVEISKQTGFSPPTVAYHRKKLGIKNFYQRKIDKIDWSKTNRTIAKELGCSYQNVQQLRRNNALPDSDKSKHNYIKIKIPQNFDWIRLNSEIAKDLGCHETYISSLRRRHKKPVLVSKHLDKIKEVGLEKFARLSTPEIINLLGLQNLKYRSKYTLAYLTRRQIQRFLQKNS